MSKQMAVSDASGQTGKFRVKAVRWIVSILIMFALGSVHAGEIDIVPTLEETSLTLIIHKGTAVEIPALISGKNAYLSVSDLFSFLKVKNNVSTTSDTISGFFVNTGDPYFIDVSKSSILYKGKEFRLTINDLVKLRNRVFLSTRSFQEIFGLECTFYIKSLSVSLSSSVELPLFREMHQEEMRKFIRKMKGEALADTAIGKRSPLFHLGAADYAIYSTQSTDGNNSTRASLAMGGYLAGGETTLGITYYSNHPLERRNQYYRWRYVNNENKILRQVVAGKIATPSISSIFSPVIGVQLTNSPTTYRKFFGTYTLSDRTEPGWIVELYINNTLVDYVKADASGYYTFQVPLAYGNTEVKLRFYGPWGEEKSKVQNILIPFTFLPKKELEYTVSAGMVEDSSNQIFYRSSFNYGLSDKFCIGAGTEYLSASAWDRNIPFLNASFSLAGKVLFTGEYAYGVRTKGLLSYRLPSNFMLEFSYIRYDKDQKAILYNYQEEKKVSIVWPLRFRKLFVNTRLTVNQITLHESLQMTSTDFVVSAFYRKFSANVHTYGYFYNTGTPLLYTDLSAGYRMPLGINITPSVRFNHRKEQFTGWKCIVEKPISGRGYFTMTYEQYSDYGIRNLQVGLRYVFAAAQTSVLVNRHNHSSSISESVSGSLLYDPATSYVKASNINKVGRGGITVIPFLDGNGNGKRDKGEPRVTGLSVRSGSGGRIEVGKSDTVVRIFNLEAYSNAFLEMNEAGFEDISWHLSNKTYKVMLEPNMMKLVEVPVQVFSEVSGTIRHEASVEGTGNKKVKVNIYNENNTLLTSFFTEEEGYYTYMSLTPGNYIIMPDTASLRKQLMMSNPASMNVKVSAGKSGSVIRLADFSLERITDFKEAESTPFAASIVPGSGNQTNEKAVANDRDANSSGIIVPSAPTDDGKYVIQAGAFLKYSNAKSVKRKISSSFRVPVEIIESTGYYKVLATGFEDRIEATIMLNKLRKAGYPGAYLRFLKDGVLQ